MKRLLLLGLIYASAFAAQPDSLTPQMTVPQSLTKADIRNIFPSAICSDESYAIVNSGWLRTFAVDYSEALKKATGGKGYSKRFDCNRFTTFFIGLAQAAYHRLTFNDSAPDNIAVGHFWYKTEQGVSHSIVVAMTEKGPLFFDPQLGYEVTVPAMERLKPQFILF
jgi:hypothetical protein